ncbi:tryptophan transporter [Lentibacillus cibarius]|uniref:Tryptophan transporter n=1 Tax=Lentibacillus cibarius TaxID=2583219 RepID=A0A549YIZ0_9BACI|nr:tryptophan transporter [Lentibacillus cibarius]TMN23032.1 tryptophan transporter [Lentibacillus cibarius]TRM11843.1 tryptophan transporter [Lentibacillus cibarius]
MNTRVLVLLSMLLGIGAVLHFIIPPFFYGMKPDMLLSMMFLGIMLFPKPKYVAILSVAAGVISALTTQTAGGQIANMIDKPITGLLFFGLVLLLKDRLSTKINVPVLTAAGTMISGSVFLTVALYIIGLMNGAFPLLFATIVLPAALLNAVFMTVVYPIVQSILKRSQPMTAT